MRTYNIIQKVAKTFKFTVRDKLEKKIKDLSGYTFSFSIKENQDDESDDFKVAKVDADFNKTDVANGIVKVSLSSDDLDLTGEYYGLLRVYESATNIGKGYFKIKLEPSEE